MRFFFLLILIAGIALGIGYPWVVQNFTGDEIATWRIYERGGTFEPVEVTLAPDDAPVRVIVDMTSIGRFYPSGSQTVLTLTAATGGTTVMAEKLTFMHQTPREDSPQAADTIYRDSPGVISPQNETAYRFVVGRGDADSIGIRTVDLILRRRAMTFDERAQPAGFTLMGLGFIGMVIALVRRRKSNAANGSGPKWGR